MQGADNAKCTICGVSVSVHHGGPNDIVKHFSTKGHWQAVNAKSSSSTLARCGFGHSDEALKARKKDEQQMQVQRAEAMFIQFVAEHTAFQATTYTTIHQLHPEKRRLTKRILCYFVDAAVIDKTDVTKTPYEDRNHHLDDERVEVGEKARLLAHYIHGNGKGREVKSFIHCVRTFYELH